jgi:hypothetical protein
MSLRTTDGQTVDVQVTPRRTQAFRPAAGSKWRPVATAIGGGRGGGGGLAPGAGPVTADAHGLLLVPLRVTPGGVRLCVEPG